MSYRLSASLVTLAAWLGACGVHPDQSFAPTESKAFPVVGGEVASPDDYPSTVALTDSTGEPFCTGTLVAPKTVVTAAHCLDQGSGDVWVAYGVTHPASLSQSELHEVVKALPHPDYDPMAKKDPDGMGLVNDIGVVVLKEPIAGAKVTPVLPPDEIDPMLYPNRDIHIAGYGIYEMPWTSGDLYKAVTPHVRHVDTEMLAGKPGKPDTCNGDSGGPAYVLKGCELWLVGVTSRAWAKSTDYCGDGGLYTLASRYIAWLEAESGEDVSPANATGLTVGVCEDAGAGDVVIDVLADVDGKCFPATSACNPLTNDGCDGAKGEVCTLDEYGEAVCESGVHTVEQGGLCDQTSLLCKSGTYCGGAYKCARFCCTSADCEPGGTCKQIPTAAGTLGTCSPIVVPDAGVDEGPEAGPEPGPEPGPEAGAGGADANGGVEASAGASGDGGAGGEAGENAEPAVIDTPDDGGCGCRTRGTGPTRAGWLLVAIGVVAGWRRRRSGRGTLRQ